jgi:hypothetical protein
MKTMFIGFFGIGLLLLSGCASYKATSLSALAPQFVKQSEELPGMVVGCKSLSQDECKTYLDRDVIKKGYQPVELTFFNQTDKTYQFSSDLVSLPCSSPAEVASKVHTSTAGRIAGYAVGSLIFTPLIIPAVVDGIRSYNANKELDIDFQSKAEKSFLIGPESYKTTLIFVPQKYFSSNFHITLLEQGSNTSKVLQVSAQP